MSDLPTPKNSTAEEEKSGPRCLRMTCEETIGDSAAVTNDGHPARSSRAPALLLSFLFSLFWFVSHVLAARVQNSPPSPWENTHAQRNKASTTPNHDFRRCLRRARVRQLCGDRVSSGEEARTRLHLVAKGTVTAAAPGPQCDCPTPAIPGDSRACDVQIPCPPSREHSAKPSDAATPEILL